MGILGAVIATGMYKEWSDIGFLTLGLLLCLPSILVPIYFPSELDKLIPWKDRYAVKASLWIALFNFVGNYFWTHYFFSLLGAAYTFPVTWKINKIPYFIFLVTQPYFLTYFVFSNMLLRKINTTIKNTTSRTILFILVVLGFSLFVSFMETWTIQSVPYYNFTDRDRMYKIGITFYALYFVVGFPMFLRLDEKIGSFWSLSRTALDALASAMIVFILCDFWRLIVGQISPGNAKSGTLPILE